MKDKLRKVTFNLNEQDLNIDDLEFKDSEGIRDERHGYFHRFGDTVFYDPQLERNLPKTVAIIEEIGTGKIYEVVPHCFKFDDN